MKVGFQPAISTQKTTIKSKKTFERFCRTFKGIVKRCF